MKRPGLPRDEEARIESLRATRLLDTPSEERFDRITRIARASLGTDIALVSLVDRDRQWFKSAQGLHAPETSRDISFCGHAILGRSLFEVNDASSDDRFADNPLVTGDPNIRFYAGQPIAAPDGNRVGTLCVIDSKPRSLSRGERELLSDLAKTVEREIYIEALSAAETQLRKDLQDAESRAAVDPLTRLWNRGAIEQLLKIEMERAMRNEDAMAIVLLDIDHFKAVNDTHGHQAGDEVLREVALRLRQNVRAMDSVGRYGGEEFLLVLGQCSARSAGVVCERVRKAIKATAIDCGAASIAVSASLGACHLVPHDGTKLSAIVGRTDRALYQAKDEGRDRVVLVSPTDTE